MGIGATAALFISRARNGLLSLFYPAQCPTCKRYIKDFKYGYVCPSCFEKTIPIKEKFCLLCGLPLNSVHVFKCRDCEGVTRYFDSVRSAGVYEGGLRDMIHELKFGGKTSTADILAGYIIENAQFSFDREYFLVPVPAWKKTTAERGYNQADLLAKALSRRTGLKSLNALAKLRETKPQRTLGKKDRPGNVEGVYGVTGRVDGLKLIVVDDVCTTGSTMNEVAKVLKKAGAAEVRGITAARAV
jgi:competence protein ComFC